MTSNELRELNSMELEIKQKKQSLMGVINMLKRTELDDVGFSEVRFKLDGSECDLDTSRVIEFLNTEKDILLEAIDKLEYSFKLK